MQVEDAASGNENSRNKPSEDKDLHQSPTLNAFSDTVKGCGPGREIGTGGRYHIRAEPAGSHSTAMIVDKSRGLLTDGVPAGEAVLRFNRTAPGFPHPHISINPNVSGRPDPHWRFPSSVVEAAPRLGEILRFANKAAIPVALAVDTYRVGQAVRADRQAKDQSHSRTKTEAAGVAGSWAGAVAGGAAGAQLGTLMFPGVGTIAGALVGAVGGSVAGDEAGLAIAKKAVKKDADKGDVDPSPVDPSPVDPSPVDPTPKIKTEKTGHLAAAVAGAAVGAHIGTEIHPGIGTFLGGALGSIGGFWAGKTSGDAAE